jgi:predicted kinase
MKQVIIFLRGIPASGKSTWARDFMDKNPGFVRVNNDEIRLELFNRVFDDKDTKAVDAERNRRHKEALDNGLNLIIDNTNLSPKREAEYRELAKKYNAEFRIQCFMHVPLKECLERNQKRPNPVPDKIIKSMYCQFVEPLLKPTPVEYVEGLEDCFVFDMDGTLSLMDGIRGPFEWHKVHLDKPHIHVVRMAKILSKTAKIIIMSGRDSCCRDLTIQWLNEQEIPFFELHMRPMNDSRKDSIVKEELYRDKLQYRFNILGWFDDRESVCDLVYSLGLPLFRVGDPQSSF